MCYLGKYAFIVRKEWKGRGEFTSLFN